MTGLRVSGLDHVVLVVADPEASLRWWCGELGLRPERAEEWRRGEVPFPSVRVDDATVIDLLAGDAPAGARNVDHLALVVDGVDVDELARSGRFRVVAGPSDLWGARGTGRGVYVADPDGHVVELRTYPA